MSDTLQIDQFNGGMSYKEDRAKIGKGQYYLMVNGRNRFNSIKPIKGPEDLTSKLPIDGAINLQGVYSFSDFVVVFAGGKGYYKNYNDTAGFNKIPALTLSATAVKIYVAAVPSSTVNKDRKAFSSTDSTLGSTEGEFDEGTESGFIVCDGVTQPWFVFADGSARQTKAYSAWNNSLGEREYVPIGIKPQFHDGILYMVAKDSKGKYTKIYRSVTGRPTDFMVNIDINGDKLPEESKGGADSVSHSISLDEITSFYPSSLENRGLIVSTLKGTWFVIPDYGRTIFGEPSFTSQGPIFNTGAVSENSLVENNSDTVLIDQSGLRSFNDIAVSKNEGRNKSFSESIQRIFGEELQDENSVAVEYEDYLLFSVQTSYGPVVIVFDTITQSFASVDNYPNIGQIKQFAILRINGIQRLFGITTSDKFVELFVGEVVTCMFYQADYGGSNEKGERSMMRVAKTTIGCSKIRTSGKIQFTYFYDGVRGETQEVNVTQSEPENVTKPLPYLPNIIPGGITRTAAFNTPHARRTAVMIETNVDLAIDWIQHEVESVSVEYDSPSDYDDIKQLGGDVYPYDLVFFGNNFETTGDKVTLIEAAKAILPDLYLGGGNQVAGSGGSLTLTPLSDYLDYENTLKKVYCCLGATEYSEDYGRDLIEYMLGHHYNRYMEYVHKNMQIFLLSSGYDQAGVLKEPHGVDVNSEQYSWFKATIAKSTARFKIVMMHHAPYTSFNPVAKTDLRWNFAELGVDLVLSSRTAAYERLQVDNIPYVNVYSGNSRETAIDNLQAESKVIHFTTSTILKLHADEFNLYCKAIDTSENVIDQFIINK